LRESPSFQPSSEFQAVGPAEAEPTPVICFSHLRWDFVFQRPQHLMSRFARRHPVIVFEEPVIHGGGIQLDMRVCETSGVTIATPRLPEGLDGPCRDAVLRQLLDEMVSERGLRRPVLWYYTPMMLTFSRHLEASAIVYDCMDELSGFRFAPTELGRLEAELFEAADVVFTGGHSLYEAKRHLHSNIHPFPSSVDVSHFGQARGDLPCPADQSGIPGPRLGYVGVIDERLDLGLIDRLAEARPEWSIIMVGPVVKISEADLPRRPNLHYLGSRSYEALPAYISGWDVALMPFALNEATRFISPTKTPEYLAAGRPVVSTAVTDVVRHYGDLEAVRIAGDPKAFVTQCEVALRLSGVGSEQWREPVDAALGQMSWDQTFLKMNVLVQQASLARSARRDRVPTPGRLQAGQRRAHYDVLVVGAGFAGAVMAERLASQSGQRVLVVDKRPHIGGNAYDRYDAAGILIHEYGPHIFHTNSTDVVDYLSRFTRWRPYEHRVLAEVEGQQVPIPINRTTLVRLYGVDLRTDEEAAAFLAERAEPREVIRTSEDVVVSAVGQDLYETFFRGYTRKQWGLDPSELDRSVTARIPTRTNTDDRYFTDAFQAMPADGYTALFEALLDHPLIDVETGLDYRAVVETVSFDHMVYTGPIDEFFDFKFGRLPYRSLRFETETLDRAQAQAVGTVNHPSEDTPFTRVTEFKHLTGQAHPQTTLMYEYPTEHGDPYYPVPRPESQALYKQYEALAMARSDVTFLGRLASYRYYNMDQVVAQALSQYRRLAPSLAAGTQVQPAAAGLGL
jgi:UDP-galactopyranose mutase